MKGASIDLNGDGKFDGNDQWGLAMGSPNDICSLLVGMGGNTIIRDSDGSPINNMLDERMINIAGKLYDSINVSKNLGFYSQQANWTIPGVSGDAKSSHMFKNGKVLFNTSIPQSLSGLSADVEFDYGVLPFPKYDEHQEMYYSFADSFGSVLFGVPFISAKTDMTGFMLEVLSGYSTDTSLNAYYEVSCKIKHVYDETSAEMLDICMDGITFDFGLMFNWGGLRNVAYKPLADGAANTYVSGCESLTQVIEKGINDLYDSVM